MKRNLFLFAIFMMGCVATFAQRLDITLDDNSIVSFDVNKIKSMEFMPESEPGQLSGYWYLGWRVMSSSTTHFNGDEKWVFNGTVMKLVKASGPRESGATVTYNIVACEEGLLVLKSGTITRHFYKSMAAAHDATFVTPFPNREEFTDTTKVWALKSSSSHSSTSPMGNHYAKYAAATQAQKEWLADPNNQPDPKLADVGSEYDRWTAKTITLYPGVNWIGYPCTENLPIATALGNLTPAEDDIIKSYNGDLATYSGGAWHGTLTTLQPGKGYIYQSKADVTKTFVFPSNN